MPLYRAELLAKKPLRYAALIHDVSQVLYLPFDYDNGSYARDRSGYNNHGTIYGATPTTGKIGMARSLDGVDDYVEVPHSGSINITGPITIAAWTRPATQEFPYSICIGKAGGWGRKGYHLGYDAGNFFRFITTSEAGIEKYVNSGVVAVDTWHYVTAVFDGSNLWLYVDLTRFGPTSQTDLGANTEPLQIGRDYIIASTFFKGIIDEVRIYNRALSRYEIRMLMYRRLV